MSNSDYDYERISKRKLSKDELEAKLDLRRGNRTQRYGKDRNRNRRAQNLAAKKEFDYA